MVWISSVWFSPSFWEAVEYIAEAIVIIGAVFEVLTDFEYILKGDEKKKLRRRVEKFAALFLICGLAIELGALVRTNQLFSLTIASLNRKAGAARSDAAFATERATTLEAIIQPRYLTDDQERQIKERLKTLAGRDLMIGSHWLDAESARLSGQVKATFNSAGVGVKLGAPEDLIGKWPRVALGLFGGGEFHGTEIHVGIEVWGKTEHL